MVDGLKRLPPDSLTAVIQGGNHAGFGHYGVQRFPRADGQRGITREEQQEQTIKLVKELFEKISETYTVKLVKERT